MKQKNKKKLYIFLHIPKCAGTTFNFHLKYNFKKHQTLYLFINHGFYNLKTKKYEYLQNINHLKKYLKSLTQEQKQKIKVIYGHTIYYGIHKFFPNQKPVYIIFVRDPFSRRISQYNQLQKSLKNNFKINSDEIGYLPFEINKEKIKQINTINKKIISFKQFSQRKNFQNNYIKLLIRKDFLKKTNKRYSKKHLEEVLKKFYFIGITENFESDFLFLSKILKFKKFYSKKNIGKKYFSLKKRTQQEINKLKKKFKKRNKLDYKLYNLALKHNKNFKIKIKDLDKIIKNQKIKKYLSIPFSEFERTIKAVYKRITRPKLKARRQ